MKGFALFIAALPALAAAPADGQSPAVERAIQSGEVGERYDGYMGAVGVPSPN